MRYQYDPNDIHRPKRILGSGQQEPVHPVPMFDLLAIQRLAGNRAATRAAATRAAGTRAAGTRAAGTRAAAQRGATARSDQDRDASVQRKVGFELELAVLADVDHTDPGYNTKLHEGNNFDLKVDHNTALKPMTVEAAKQKEASGVTVPYSSIVEVVTKPVDETAPDAIARFKATSQAVQLFAKNVRSKTQGFDHRVALESIVPTALAGSHLGLDTAALGIPNRQALDANIQATIGLDLAQAPAALRYLSRKAPTGQPQPILQDVTGAISDQLVRAAENTKKVFENFKTRFGLVPDKENQGYANLEGLLSLVVLYLRTAALWSHWSETRGDTSGIDAMTPKNFTPLLSHTDLGSLHSSLTAAEQLVLLEDDKLQYLKKVVLLAGRANLGFDVKPDVPMLKWGSLKLEDGRDRLGPLPAQFVENVLTGEPDGLTTDLLHSSKMMPAEPVGRPNPGDPTVAERQPDPTEQDAADAETPDLGPAELEGEDDLRRRGAVVEFRSLANRLQGLQSALGTSKFPVDAWDVLMAEVFYTVRELNLRTGDSPGRAAANG